MEDMDLNAGRDFFNTNCVLGGFDNRKTAFYTAVRLMKLSRKKRVQYRGRIVRCRTILICYT